MVTVRRASERHHQRTSKQNAWFTFGPQDRVDRAEPGGDDFGSLEQLNDISIAPGTSAPRNARRDVEIVTYVYQGVLAYEDSLGHSGVLQAGEFHRVTSGRSLRHSKMNASRTDWAHFYQLWLYPSETELDSEHVQKRFTAAERRGGLCVVASPDARRGSLRIHEDALVCSALLDPGQHVVRELSRGRSAWVHVLQGEIRLGDAVLTSGDGAGITDEHAVSLTAREKSEILLVDVVALPMTSTRSGRP
jgi:redox-sensitive bicupin YhaK (pirin superfamily)